MAEIKDDNILEMKMVSEEVYDGVEDDFEVEFEISPALETNSEIKACRDKINEGLSEVDAQLDTIQNKINDLNKEIDRLTNNADGVDYIAAVFCGIVSGAIDITLVGEWNFKDAKAKSDREINKKVSAFAKKDPDYFNFCNYTKTGRKRKNPLDPNRLESATLFLEDKYKLPGDSDWKFTGSGISANSHHLDDLCHHPTLMGLISCIMVQFTGQSIYYNKSNNLIQLPIEVNDYGHFVGEEIWAKLFAGILNWFFNVAETIKNTKGHWMSDIIGSSSAKNEGAGLPGIFISTAKEISMLPCFQNSDFGDNLRKAYEKGIGTGKGQLDLGPFNSLFVGTRKLSSRMDVRTERAIIEELERQSLPVIVNEVFVRAFYFIRRFIQQMKEKKTLLDIEWDKVLPFKNRTIVRMVTIASGTFEAVDMAEAAISAARKSGGAMPVFWSNFVLKVNFVGVGRFAVAVLTDVGMGVKREVKVNERIETYSQQRILLNTKVFYKDANNWCDIAELYEKVASMYDAEAEMWSEAEKAEVATEELLKRMKQVVKFYNDSMEQLYKDLFEIAEALPEAEKKNPGITQIILGED